MARPRSSIAELERLLRAAEPGSNNLGQYLAEVGDDLAPRLGIALEELAALVELPDEQVAPRLDEALQRRSRDTTAVLRAEVALAAAERLGATAVWTRGVAAVDVGLLFSKLLVDPERSYIVVDVVGLHSRFRVSLPRSLLVNTAKELERHRDLVAWLDEAGLHLRWNGGRGGLNFISQRIPARETPRVLVVRIPPPVLEKPSVAPATRHMNRWVCDVLSEISFA